MTEYEKKVKYKNIVYNLRVINTKINNLNNKLKTLNQAVENGIKIDDIPFNINKLQKSKTTINDVSKRLKESIIPSIDSKI